jgi:hypothetical protein
MNRDIAIAEISELRAIWRPARTLGISIVDKLAILSR